MRAPCESLIFCFPPRGRLLAGAHFRARACISQVGIAKIRDYSQSIVGVEMPGTCATTRKLDEDFWSNVFRRGLKNLNRIGKSDITVLNRVRV